MTTQSMMLDTIAYLLLFAGMAATGIPVWPWPSNRIVAGDITRNGLHEPAHAYLPGTSVGQSGD